MSVAEDWTLPAQPTIGTVNYVPLGGDGFQAPFAAYNVMGAAIVGDAGGGSARVTCRMDDRFCSLVAFFTGQNAQDTPADGEFRFFLAADQIPQQVNQGDLTALAAGVDSHSLAHTMVPTPIVLPGGSRGPGVGADPRIDVRFLNALADVVSMDALIYLFNIRVREVMPMGPLLWARGAT